MIGIVDYGAGNLTSVKLALNELGKDAVIERDPNVLLQSERLIFPGVGAAGAAMQKLREFQLLNILPEFLRKGKPVLGVCLGAQIVLEKSEEDGGTDCMGILPGTTRCFTDTVTEKVKVPHMGWNQVHFDLKHPLFEKIPQDSEFYFVHSYYPAPAKRELILAHTAYGGIEFPSILGEGNLVVCQFHPEKSGKWGLQLLENFCGWESC